MGSTGQAQSRRRAAMNHPDESTPLSRRDLLKLGAASVSVPFLALPAPTSASVQPPSLPIPTGSTLEGEDHPAARGRTINNLNFMGLALHNFTAVNGGRLPAAA